MTDARIVKALEIAASYGGVDGGAHKMWVIDQMVRALTGCPAAGNNLGVNDEYLKFVATAKDGEWGPETYRWDTGIAP